MGSLGLFSRSTRGCGGPCGPCSGSVHDDQLGAIAPAETMGRGVRLTALGADLAPLSRRRWVGRACRAKEPVGHELVGVLRAKTRVLRVPAATSRADHALGEGTGGRSLVELSTVSNAEVVTRGIVLGEAHGAATRDAGGYSLRLGSVRRRWPCRARGGGAPLTVRVGPPAPSSREDEPACRKQHRTRQYDQLEDHSTNCAPPGSARLQKSPGWQRHPGLSCVARSSIQSFLTSSVSVGTTSNRSATRK